MATKSESLEISHLGTGESKDETLLAAVAGQEHRLFGWHLVCQGPRDNKLRNRWIISDGQLFDTGSIQVIDHAWGTVTLTDNSGNTATFELDSGDGVTTGNVQVLIGADFDATASNLYDAIVAQGFNLDVTLSTDTVSFVEEEWDVSTNTMSQSGTSFTLTDFSGGGGTILAQGYGFNHQPHVSSFAFGGTISAPVSVQCSTITALYLTVLGEPGMTLAGNVYYATE